MPFAGMYLAEKGCVCACSITALYKRGVIPRNDEYGTGVVDRGRA